MQNHRTGHLSLKSTLLAQLCATFPLREISTIYCHPPFNAGNGKHSQRPCYCRHLPGNTDCGVRPVMNPGPC